MDMKQSEYNLTVEETDLVYYTKTFKDLNPNHRDHTRMILIYIGEDLWEFRVVGLTSREWLEFCAYVYAEIPSSPTEDEERVPAPEMDQNWPTSLPADSPLREMEPEGAPDEEEVEYEDDDSEPEEEEVEEPTNSEGETPGEEVQRKLKKAVLVKKTKDSSVTVEED